ncbi:MarR family winged helix-turn-helix transcriptional regulator [Cupriavidus sp. AU9028]|uniref:MarR family winged helix-turn-helix transcriptional regulator n=1 Tax=Cupriavidus sp. AU9028 TaxID=2871157 RepID=UPI0021072133|nr:MarR family winged helix-turn-helix transcriptional regulator [Cupriavidus sp. AU9028]
MAKISKKDFKSLHGAMVDLFALMNLPGRDDVLLREAGLSLDRALFPLLVGIDRYGPIGVVALAERAGRDYTTVSRQVTRLESLGLVERKPNPVDRRVNEAVLTAEGRKMTDALDAARIRLAAPALAEWSDDDFRDLVRLLRRFVDGLMTQPNEP